MLGEGNVSKIKGFQKETVSAEQSMGNLTVLIYTLPRQRFDKLKEVERLEQIKVGTGGVSG